MKTTPGLGTLFALVSALTLAACATTAPYPPNQPAYGTSRTSAPRPQYGVVYSIERIRPENTGIGGSSVGVGTIAGAVVGGIIGNQIGAGRGNTLATVAGAAGGAYVGHELENRQQADAYKVTVRLNNGSYQAVMQNTDTDLRVGDRVWLENGNVQRY